MNKPTAMPTAYESLQAFVNKIHPLSDLEMAALLDIWQPETCRRKVQLARAGETARSLYFITEGIQRVFYSDELDREATIVFTYAPSFGGVADSFLTQTPSRFFAETLTPSAFLKTSFTQLDQLMQQHHAIERMIRLGTNYAFMGVLERMIEIQCYSAEDKFRTLMKRSPHLLNLVPHKYLANYLGIDATNFSKLLSRIKI